MFTWRIFFCFMHPPSRAVCQAVRAVRRAGPSAAIGGTVKSSPHKFLRVRPGPSHAEPQQVGGSHHPQAALPCIPSPCSSMHKKNQLSSIPLTQDFALSSEELSRTSGAPGGVIAEDTASLSSSKPSPAKVTLARRGSRGGREQLCAE